MDTSSLNSNGTHKVRLQGVFHGEIPTGETLVMNWVVPSEKIMNGADYVALNCNIEDRITFQVVHPTYGVIDQFADRLFARQAYVKQLYGARLIAGLTVRVIYENNGINLVKFNLNLDLHERVL